MAGKERVVSASLKTKPGPGGPGAALQRQGRHAPQDGRAGIGEGLSAWSDSEDQRRSVCAGAGVRARTARLGRHAVGRSTPAFEPMW
jgi:hypothetical protein